MEEHTRNHSDPQHACIACGHTRPEAAMRPFGRRDGRVVTWACRQCLDATPAPAPDRPRELVEVAS